MTNKALIMRCDAPPYGVVGFLLNWLPSGEERPIIFASRTMSQVKKKHFQIDKEALSIIFGVEWFYMFVNGWSFEIRTGHMPLLGLLREPKGIQQTSSLQMLFSCLSASSSKEASFSRLALKGDCPFSPRRSHNNFNLIPSIRGELFTMGRTFT